MEMEGNLSKWSRTFGDLSHVALAKFVRVHQISGCCVEMAQQGDVANLRRSVPPAPQSTAIYCGGANPVTNGIGRDWLGRQYLSGWLAACMSYADHSR
jgi:hypothetical protein